MKKNKKPPPIFVWNRDVLRRERCVLTCDSSFGDDMRDAEIRRPKPDQSGVTSTFKRSKA